MVLARHSSSTPSCLPNSTALPFRAFYRGLGSISYSLYISHFLLIRWIANFPELWQISPAAIIVGSILLSIGVAAVLHRFVEAPTLDWGRKLTSRRAGDVPLAFPDVGDLQKP